MTKHSTGTRDEWMAARLELLNAEKDLTRRSEELARRSQALPWVRVLGEWQARRYARPWTKHAPCSYLPTAKSCTCFPRNSFSRSSPACTIRSA